MWSHASFASLRLGLAIVVPLVEAQVVRSTDTTSSAKRDGVKRCPDHPLVVDVGGRDGHGHRHTARVGQNVALDPAFGAIGRVGTRMVPLSEPSPWHCRGCTTANRSRGKRRSSEGIARTPWRILRRSPIPGTARGMSTRTRSTRVEALSTDNPSAIDTGFLPTRGDRRSEGGRHVASVDPLADMVLRAPRARPGHQQIVPPWARLFITPRSIWPSFRTGSKGYAVIVIVVDGRPFSRRY
jgi:hypothetical protein